MIPRGSKIVGHVTEVKAREKGQAESAVGVVFDHAVLKDGSQCRCRWRCRPSAAVCSGSSCGGFVVSSEKVDCDAAVSPGTASGMSRIGGGAVGGVHSTTGSLVNTAGRVGGATVNTRDWRWRRSFVLSEFEQPGCNWASRPEPCVVSLKLEFWDVHFTKLQRSSGQRDPDDPKCAEVALSRSM